MEDALGFIRLLVLFVVLVSSVYTDIAFRRIFTWITIPAIIIGLVLALISCFMLSSWKPMVPALLGLGVGFITFFIPYTLGWVSGGDVRLMAAIGALQDPKDLYFIFRAIFYTSMVGACMAVILLIWQKRLLSGVLDSFKLLVKPKSRNVAIEYNATLPYGVAMVGGTIWTLILSFQQASIV